MERQIIVRQTHFINNPYKRIFIYKLILFASNKACLHNDTTNVDHIIKKIVNKFLCANLNTSSFFFHFS